MDDIEKESVDEVDGGCISRAGDTDDKMDNHSHYRRQLFAFMASEKYAHSYKMDHKFRGHALIFNHKFFRNMDIRAGTIEDCSELSQCLENLGFSVHVHQDMKKFEIENYIYQASRWNHNDCDCFFVAVLSHGDVDVIYASDIQYKPDLLWLDFTPDKCPSLAGKPKIFMLDVGRGRNVDVGVTLMRTRRSAEFDTMRQTYRIPLEADFLIAYSTPLGYSHWHDENGRSWYIKALCEELKHRGYTDHMLSILTHVNSRVAIDYESNYPQEEYKHRNKQVPCFVTMLTRFLQFTPKNYNKSSIQNDTNNNA